MAIRSNSEHSMMAEINITPMVDVMLVLLVVFIVTAPLITSQSTNVDIPQATGATKDHEASKSHLVILPNGNLLMDNQPITDQNLLIELQAKANNPDFQLQVKSDSVVPYGRISEIMALAQSRGVKKISFVGSPPQRK